MTELEILCKRGANRIKRSGKLRFTVVLLVVFAFAVGSYALFIYRLRPAVIELAKQKIATVYTRIINDALARTLQENEVTYSDMVYLEKNHEGQISALCTNTAMLNTLCAQITGGILDRAQQVEHIDIKLPLGSVVGSPLLSGFGPTVRVRLIAGESMKARFDTGFTEAGINQTLHRIVFSGEVACTALFPGTIISCLTQFQIVTAETVIVGGIPESYTYFSGVEDATKAIDYYYNYQ